MMIALILSERTQRKGAGPLGNAIYIIYFILFFYCEKSTTHISSQFYHFVPLDVLLLGLYDTLQQIICNVRVSIKFFF